LKDTKLNIKSVELTVQSKVYESGKIVWQMFGGSKALLPTPGKLRSLSANQGRGKQSGPGRQLRY
jgi:hypothetical protein